MIEITYEAAAVISTTIVLVFLVAAYLIAKSFSANPKLTEYGKQKITKQIWEIEAQELARYRSIILEQHP